MIGVIQESDDLPAGAVCTGAELAIARTTGDVDLRRPCNGVGVVSIGGNIAEAAAAHCGRTGSPVQESNGLGAIHSGIRSEGVRTGAAGDAVLYRPQDGIIIVITRIIPARPAFSVAFPGAAGGRSPFQSSESTSAAAAPPRQLNQRSQPHTENRCGAVFVSRSHSQHKSCR